jgi:hypothetical protein
MGHDEVNVSGPRGSGKGCRIIDNDAGRLWRLLWRKSPGRNVDP